MSEHDGDGVVIVGASIGGVMCAETLRAEGYEGPITVLGAETTTPYNRPPLSKQVLTGEWTGQEPTITDRERLASIGVDLLLGVEATSLDTARRVVTAGGREMAYDDVVIATGVRPRRLPAVARPAGVHELRTLDDAVALREEFAALIARGPARVVVVGSGVLGSELAAACRSLGADVALVGRTSSLRLGQVGDRLSSRLARLHAAAGVTLVAGADVAAIDGTARVEAVRLGSGATLPADLVVVAVGCLPAVEWLAGSGLHLADGVVCDSSGRAADGVWAVGDVAAWRDDATGVARRAEHQQGAIEQAQAVARLLATGSASPRPLPFFWSDLHGTRIQSYGDFAGGGRLVAVEGDPETDDRFVAESRAADGRVVGVVGWNHPRGFRLARARVGTRPDNSSVYPAADLVGAAKGSQS
ncbi:NAD(P)/FAD-dependent oxidoreductase [Frondihabitans australicus]|uniref:NAD/ferredoxin-dependent reductase-like protein n=1 Tax=Frondihabitans australicus TaxID=386892 RepID=A0A495IDP0_9MICO|nr:FAD-dependent oxidoreductase [Frondihabitans australicus]RKR73598.1 NAD/ferredoxin-dependent reductase-like protein [Frondihabitans australicus]